MLGNIVANQPGFGGNEQNYYEMPVALLFARVGPAAGEFIDGLTGRIGDAAQSRGPQVDDNQGICRQCHLVHAASGFAVELLEAVDDLIATLAVLLEMHTSRCPWALPRCSNVIRAISRTRSAA